ncbi:MAG: metalloregulator ArsR/SmtB family transcription factor [Candidatus Hydrothermarchaeaceae archaeon]
MMEDGEKKRLEMKTKVFKIFSDPTRLRILEVLRVKETNVSELVEELDLKQSTVSQHLKMLKDCGAVDNWKDGRESIYRLRDKRVGEIMDLGEELLILTIEDMASCVCK